jgi:hypothetical protein
MKGRHSIFLLWALALTFSPLSFVHARETGLLYTEPNAPTPGASNGESGAQPVPDPAGRDPVRDLTTEFTLRDPADRVYSINNSNKYVTVPADFPGITVTVPAHDVGEGYVLASNFVPGPPPYLGSYLLMLDNQGEPVYYQKLSGAGFVTDFRKLENGLLAYWDQYVYHLLDNTYTEVYSVTASSGYFIDLHDLRLLPNGNYLYMIYDSKTVDMSQIVAGGYPTATVTGLIIQEQDPNKNVVFQWSSWDHFLITDTNQGLNVPLIDYVHGNALELDEDGNLLLSSRNLDEITKIDHQTGDIIWRLGGKRNQFTFAAAPGITDDPHFYYQHDIRRLPNGHITLFDNHNLHSPEVSRALEFVLDEVNKTATLVWEYRNTPDVFSGFMGNVQRLFNGNTMIGWGGYSTPALTELKPDGTKALEMSLSGGNVSYRALRFPWQGYPTWAPVLVIQQGSNSIRLTFSWNGATEIARYQIYAGNTAVPTTLIGEQLKSGFETSVNLVGIQTNYCFYRVMPIDKQGQPTQYSNVAVNPACNFLYMPMVASAGN